MLADICGYVHLFLPETLTFVDIRIAPVYFVLFVKRPKEILREHQKKSHPKDSSRNTNYQ